MSGRPSASTEVSVVIPVRNGEAFVADACRSALEQTDVEVEVLVIENGSTDDTVGQVLSVADPRVRLLHQDPPGVSRARNLGVDRSSAPWVAFLDADDRWSSGKLRRQLDAAGNAQLVFTDAAVMHEGELVGSSFHQVNAPPTPSADLLMELLSRPNFIPLSSVLVKRESVIAVGGFRKDLSHSEDWDLWLRLALGGCTATWVPEALVNYRVHPAGASRDLRAIYLGEVESLRELHPQLERRGAGDVARHRMRASSRLAVVYGRRPDAPLADRLRDLGLLLRTGASWRSYLAQLAYTAVPAKRRRARTSPLG